MIVLVIFTVFCFVLSLSACVLNTVTPPGGDVGEEPGGDIGEEPGEVPTENLEYTLSSDGEYYIIAGIGSATETHIVIASKIDGIPVKSIGNNAFADNNDIKSVYIPDGVTSIGEGAFLRCGFLERVNIPESVTSIGKGAFMHCEFLESIVIPDSIKEIEEDVFNYCMSLNSLEIGENVESIGTQAFYKCVLLKKLQYLTV